MFFTVFKKVELFEEDRLQKNEGFRKRKLTWRQKLKRLFTGKDSVEEYGDRSLDDSKGEGGEYTKMTEEEMETIEKEVEGAKTDTSALNMINDQIAIFGFIGESKKDRKKRIKEEKKAEKAAKKEVWVHLTSYNFLTSWLPLFAAKSTGKTGEKAGQAAAEKVHRWL